MEKQIQCKVEQEVRADALKDSRKSMLGDVFDKGEEGYGQWQNFMNEEYYENYL